jgi:hypothetical protein
MYNEQAEHFYMCVRVNAQVRALVVIRALPLLPQIDGCIQKLVAIRGRPGHVWIVPKQIVLLVGTEELRAIRLENPVDAIHQRIFVATAELIVRYIVEQPLSGRSLLLPLLAPQECRTLGSSAIQRQKTAGFIGFGSGWVNH